MNFEFLRPVFTGDTIICEIKIKKYEKIKKIEQPLLQLFYVRISMKRSIKRGFFRCNRKLTTLLKERCKESFIPMRKE